MVTVTIALIALAVLYPLVGRLGVRFGARRVLVPGILLFGLGMMSLSLVGNSLALYTALTVLVGMAGVVQSPLLYSMVVAHRAPLHSRGKLIAICTRSEEHTSELQSLMRISYAVFCLKKKIQHTSKRNMTVITNINEI